MIPYRTVFENNKEQLGGIMEQPRLSDGHDIHCFFVYEGAGYTTQGCSHRGVVTRGGHRGVVTGVWSQGCSHRGVVTEV